MKNILIIGNTRTYKTIDNGITRFYSNGDYTKLSALIHSTTIHEVVFHCRYSYESLSRETQLLIATHSPIVEGDITLCNRYPNTEIDVQEDIDYFTRKLNMHIPERMRPRIQSIIDMLEEYKKESGNE